MRVPVSRLEFVFVAQSVALILIADERASLINATCPLRTASELARSEGARDSARAELKPNLKLGRELFLLASSSPILLALPAPAKRNCSPCSPDASVWPPLA